MSERTVSPVMRLAYADPPYPGKAHLYPENTEVDHVELIRRLREYDGWALSTDEVSLAYVLSLCPPKTRVLAWCRSTAPPFQPYPYASWEPVLCSPARSRNIEPVRSYIVTGAVTGPSQKEAITGQKTRMFCDWIIRSLGAQQGDTLDDLFPGSGVMGERFEAFTQQRQLFSYIHSPNPGRAVRENMLRRVGSQIPELESVTRSERRPKA